MSNYKCKCGETDPELFYGHKKSICGKCHNAYTLQRGHAKRKFALSTLGDKCINCGYNKYQCSLDIHHLDPTLKDSKFAGMRGWSEKRILTEIKNCVILCKNCHAAFHNGDITDIGI